VSFYYLHKKKKCACDHTTENKRTFGSVDMLGSAPFEDGEAGQVLSLYVHLDCVPVGKGTPINHQTVQQSPINDPLRVEIRAVGFVPVNTSAGGPEVGGGHLQRWGLHEEATTNKAMRRKGHL
jgi:hypothetical protein